MSEVYRYTTEDAQGQEEGLWEQHQYDEAWEFARRNGRKLIRWTYEYADSELLDDFTDGVEGGG